MYNSSYPDEKFTAYSEDDETIARLTVRHSMPVGLRVSEKIDDRHGYSVAELVFHARDNMVSNYSEYALDSWGDPIPGEGEVTEWPSNERYADLTASGYPLKRKIGLRVVRISDIPEVQQLLLDSGVRLLTEGQ
jgi:hypothetical protein